MTDQERWGWRRGPQPDSELVREAGGGWWAIAATPDEVVALVKERDALRARVAELESRDRGGNGGA